MTYFIDKAFQSTFFHLRTMATWASFIALLGCNTAKLTTVPNQVTSGPLSIHWVVEHTASGAWYNLGGKPGWKDATSYFSITHQGKPVAMSTGNGKATYFWQALFLKDAPKPAVLVGTHSMYLITDDNGQVNVKSLDGEQGDFGKYQWLDSENGQPGKQHKVYQIDDSKSSRFLSGGRYLLINTRLLLDVQTLATYPIDNNSAALVQQLDGFNAFQSEVVCLSPEKTQLVLIGYRRNPQTNVSEYALVAIDFVKNRAYAIPFDRTATRFFSIWDATPSWASTYFDWTTNSQGKEVLSLHSFKQLPYWQGKLDLHPNTDQPAQYEIRPVLPGMIPHFMQCVRQQYPTTAGIKTKETGEQIITEFSIDGKPITLYFNVRDKTLTLLNADKGLVKTIGEAFDKELAKGNFQNEFGRFDSD
jgi:hypothetical protein